MGVSTACQAEALVMAGPPKGGGSDGDLSISQDQGPRTTFGCPRVAVQSWSLACLSRAISAR